MFYLGFILTSFGLHNIELLVSMAGAKNLNNCYTYGTVMKFDKLIDFAIINHMRGSAKFNFHFLSNSY